MRRQIRWEIERGQLVRHVERLDGRAYTHRCKLPVLQEVCWYAEEHAAHGITTNELWEALPDLPATQLSVALEFLKERGIIETRGRRNYAVSSTLFEDAMTEFYALEA